MKIIIFYLLIGSIKSLANLVNFFRCIYLSAKIAHNHQKNQPRNNYIYAISVNGLLRKADIDSVEIKIEDFANKYNSKDISESLYQASAVYIHRFKHSFFWGYYLIKRMLIFRPIFHRKPNPNIFITILGCIAEGVGIHLFCTYVDKAGISDKILTALSGFLSAIWQHLQNLI